MPRWKALPDELDPQVREFANQLRRLVDRSGLSIAAVSDRTGYSKTSWERYLNGRLLAPKGAIVALAEVTGTPPVHLITMWELAERAWSRSEMRHDMTMQAIRISQARAALGELATNPPVSSKDAKSGKSPRAPKESGGAGKARGGVGAVTGVAGPAGVSPTVPPVAREPEGVRYGAQARGAASAGPTGADSAAAAAQAQARAQAPATPSSRSYEASAPPGSVAATSSVSPGDGGGGPGSVAGPGADGKSPDGQRRKRKLTMFLAGIVGALVVIAAAVFLTDIGKDDDGDGKAGPSTAPTTSKADLPAGVECSGADCTGKDPENMGCGGEFARTTSRVTVVGTKTLVEVRYSKTCGAAWARITQAAPGDKVTITGSGSAARQTGTVNADLDAYTPMVAVKNAAAAKACATLKAGGTPTCTK
ncbi:helix-turn-helix domain-containing protein [Streptomyces alboflavus]|uniref:helix-turn-helix domain-containing protein n=2 Tax=Streptomyces TaxID=1883 RepID=UPI000F6583D6|nr:XRE family transcriptional regulator [Streptomyces alboflavus]